MIQTHESNKGTEEFKDSSEASQKEEERRQSSTPSPTRNFPTPSCAICLEHIQNKSFTDSCFHMFCFTCLVQWSKIKPECPLCKKSFESILHNVRSFKDYDQYYINETRNSDSFLQRGTERFRYNTTLTPDSINERNQNDTTISYRIESEIASYRMQYATQSIHGMFLSSQPGRRVPCAFRRRVYDENLWIRPSISTRGGYRSPAFFRNNTGYTRYRLLPWLNRELSVVMSNNENQISFVIELIMDLIVKHEITSQSFYTLIESYTVPHTGHFIHEFYNFAISNFEMERYDLYAHYSSPYQPTESVLSPDSDVIPLPMNESSFQKSTESTRNKKQKRNVISTVPFVNYDEGSSTLPFELAGPSNSRDVHFQEHSTEISNIETDKIECLEGRDDECQVVDVLLPRNVRTPEIVDLFSDDEVLETVVPTVVTSTIKSNPEISLNTTKEEDNDDIIFISESVRNTAAPVPTSGAVSDKLVDYSVKTSDKMVEVKPKNPEVEPCSLSDNNSTKTETSESKTKPVLQSVVHVVSNRDSRSWSPVVQPLKKRVILDDDSTESYSESAQVPEMETRVKKPKLRSVVAHFSYDSSDEQDSSHCSPSLHKKRKEQKKKRKHKSKRRIYSSDSDY